MFETIWNVQHFKYVIDKPSLREEILNNRFNSFTFHRSAPLGLCIGGSMEE
jgi:hypothetical protein